MASFDITAQINLRGPTNVRKIASDIRRQLGNIKTNIDLKIDAKTAKNVATINTNFKKLNQTLLATKGSVAGVSQAFNALNASMQSLGKSSATANQSINNVTKTAKQASQATKQIGDSATDAATGFRKFGADAALAVRRFAAFTVVSSIIGSVTSAVRDGLSNFVEYERELAKVQQVTGTTANGLERLSKGIQQAAVSTGAAATELAKVSVVLSQAGLSARETEEALSTLAKTTLAPTFANITDTTEGAIAIMRQFSIETSELEVALGSINAVAGQFAVSASDIITAVKQAGAVFASSSKGISEGTDALNEFIAVFTSVRQTTRESAETIGTGLKTIITRLQRLDTIQSLQNFGIQLTDLEGKFVGPFEAIKRLNEGLNTLDPRDIRFGAIIEELGGFRQVGKVIPLIQQFAVAQEALNVAKEGGTSITDQQIIAEQTLAVQLQKTGANFQELITNIANSDSFQQIAKGALFFTNALIDLVDALKDVLPVLAAIAANAAIPALAQFAGGFAGKLLGRNKGGPVPYHFASGGYVPGRGDKDTVPAMLTPGEFVIRKKAVQAIGTDALSAMNGGQGAAIATQAKNKGGMIQHFAAGGEVQVSFAKKAPSAQEEKQIIGDNLVNAVNGLSAFYSSGIGKTTKIKKSEDPRTAVPNYAGAVGGIFEKAVELVSQGTSEKGPNNAVWDYPGGIADSSLFQNAPAGKPTDAKKSKETAGRQNVEKKLQAHYNTAKGTELNRTKFGIVVMEKGTDFDYEFDPSDFKSKGKSSPRTQNANRGGMIQYFMDGDEVKVMGSGKVGAGAIKAASSEQLQALLKNPKVNEDSKKKIQAELNTRNANANATNVAVVGILPLGYSKDFRPETLGPELVKLHARGLAKDKEPVLLNIAEGLRGVVDKAAVDLTGQKGQKLGQDVEKATGLENIQGNIFEAVLSALGAKGGTIQNQALDYENGLGPAASLFPGIGPTWPTEVKRDVDGSGRTRAKKEFARYFSEKSQMKNLGGMIQKFADGGKVKSKGGLGIKTTGGNTITSVFEDGQSSTGEVLAKSIGQNLFAVMSSQVSGGGGRALYDSAMKQATSQGGSLVSDRSRVSSSALSRIWTTYFSKGTSKDGKRVSKRPVPDDMLYTGAFFDESDYPSPNPSSWQGKAVPLQYAYQQFADGGAASGGDTVPAMLTPGEFVINKKAAKSIGLSKLREMNYADKIQGYARGGPVGGVQYFNDAGLVTGGGSSDPCCPDELTTANMNAKTAKKMEEAADEMSHAGDEMSDGAQENTLGMQIAIAMIGPAIEAGLKAAFPDSAGAAAAGNAIQQTATTYQTTTTLLSTLGSVLGAFGKKGKILANVIGKYSTKIAAGLGLLAGVFGARSAYLGKSIDLLNQELNNGAKGLKEAFKEVEAALKDPARNAGTIADALGQAAQKIGDQSTVASASAGAQKQQLQPYLPYFEGDEGKRLREAKENSIDEDVYGPLAADARKQLEGVINSGQKLEEVFNEMSEAETESLKEAIAQTNKSYRGQRDAIKEQMAGLDKNSVAYKQLDTQLDDLRDSYYAAEAGSVAIAAKLRAAEEALEENRRRLSQATSSLQKYTDAFATAIQIAGADFKLAGARVKSYSDGFAGVDVENLFAENIKRIDNPSAFTDAENRTARAPLDFILNSGGNDNAAVFKELASLPNKIEAAVTKAAVANAGKNSEAMAAAVSNAIDSSLGDFQGTTIGNSILGKLESAIAKATSGAQGSADPEEVIKAANNEIEKITESFNKASKEAFKLLQQAFSQIVASAQAAEVSLNKFRQGVLEGAQSSRILAGDLKRLISGNNRPRSVTEVNSRTTDAAREQVSGLQSFLEKNNELQLRLIDLSVTQQQTLAEGNTISQETATAIGRTKGEIVNLRAATENLKQALSAKLGELKGELSNRLAELKEEQQANLSLIDGLFTDEQGTNKRVSQAMTLAEGGDIGNVSGKEALAILKDIKLLQQAGMVPDDPKILENAYKNAFKATGINLNPLGQEVFGKAFAEPEEDSEVKKYVNELNKTNRELSALTNALNFNDLTNSNDALIESQNALASVIKTLPETVEALAAKLFESGLKAPIEVLQADRMEIANVKKLDISKELGVEGATPVTKAVGGIIYRSTGGEGPSAPSISTGPGSNINWAPRGSDTVPAMLTPGEYVVNAQATKANRGLLENINSGKGRKVQPIYRAAGGPTDTSERGWIDYIDQQTRSGRKLIEETYALPGVVKVWPGIVQKLTSLGSTLGGWVGGAKDTIYGGLASQFTKYGNYEGQILPKYIIEAIKNGTISETTGLGSVPKKAWSNLVPRIINNIGNTRISKSLTKFGGSLWGKIASPMLNTAVQGSKYAADLPSSLWQKLISSPMLKKFAATTNANLPLAEWGISGLLAGRSRYEELEKKGAGAGQIVMSSIAEFLAGGTSPAPSVESSYAGIASAGLGNASRLFSNIFAGYSKGGPPGAVAAGLVTVGGMGIRLAEETVGWRNDILEEQGSYDLLTKAERETTKSFQGREAERSKGKGATKNLDDTIEILGPKQYNRAKRSADAYAVSEWYKENKGKFKFESDEPSGGLLKILNDYWGNGQELGKVGGTIASSKLQGDNESLFSPDLIPEKQKASFSSGNVFYNEYSDAEIQEAYAKTIEEIKARKLAQFNEKGAAVGRYANDQNNLINQPVVLENVIPMLRDRADAIYLNTRGQEDPVTGKRDGNWNKALLEQDEEYKDIQDKLGQVFIDSADTLSGIPADLTTPDLDIKARGDDQIARAVAIEQEKQKRKDELDGIAIQEEKDRIQAEAEKKKDRSNSNTAAAKAATNATSLFTGERDGTLMENPPYINIKDQISAMQQQSVNFRSGLNDEALEGVKFGSYLDFILGNLGPDANSLLKSQGSIDTVKNIGTAIQQYRKAYRQSSPIWEQYTSKFQADIDNWQQGEAEPKVAGVLKARLFSGRGDISKDVLDSLSPGDSKTEIMAEEIAVQMGYKSLENYTKDQGKFNEDKKNGTQEEKQAAEKWLTEREGARNQVAIRRKQDAIASLDPDRQIEARLVETVSKSYGEIAGKVTGAGFYRTGNEPLFSAVSYPDEAAQAGFNDIQKFVGPTFPNLQAGPLDEWRLDGTSATLFYARKLIEAQEMSSQASPEQIAGREENIEIERKAASAEAAAFNQRYKQVVAFGKNLVSNPVPEQPVAWLKWKAAKVDRFKKIADATNTQPPYPEAIDMPALGEAGVTQTWVDNIFNRGDGGAVSSDGAKELLRWKAKQEGENAQELLALAQQIDGNVGFNDIYSGVDGDSGLRAATDLQNIWKETQKFSNSVLSRDKLAVPLLEKNLERLSKSGLWTPERGLENNLKALNSLDPRLDQNGIREKIGNLKTGYYSDGGAVFTPKGTDTVPAMLTPGEFIVNRKAAAANRPLLESINGGRGNQSRRKGYYNDGGDVSGNGVNNITMDTQEISKFITSFDRFAKELAALSIPEQITIQGTHTVEVNINGAQVLNDLLNGPIGDLVQSEIAGAFALQSQDSEGAVPNPYNTTLSID